MIYIVQETTESHKDWLYILKIHAEKRELEAVSTEVNTLINNQWLYNLYCTRDYRILQRLI